VENRAPQQIKNQRKKVVPSLTLNVTTYVLVILEGVFWVQGGGEVLAEFHVLWR